MVRILKERDGVYNAYEMGLGKTIQAIEACQLLECKKVLVICPAVVKLVWNKEVKLWRHTTIDFCVHSYDHAAKYGKELSENHFDCLILDESHKVKNHLTKRAKAIFTHLWPKIHYKIALSGTPFTSSVIDCWTLFSRFAPEHFKDYWKFVYTYTKVVRTPFDIKFEGIKNADKLKKIIRSTFFIRRTKEEVLPELPEKTWQKITLPESLAIKMTPEQEKAQIAYQKKLIAAFKSGQPVRTPPPVSSATWRREQGLKKIPSIVEFSQNLLDQEIPIVIFCYHKEFVEKLNTSLKKYNPVVITGETNAKDREHAVGAFQEGGSNLFIGNIEAAGVGITLTRSSTVLLAEFSWIPSTIQQAVARCHRIGQRSHVNVYYFVVENSIEEDIIEAVMDRAKDFKSVLE